jgi:dimeric dUTPase (all-alpha-NTP-PPase superfamily)
VFEEFFAAGLWMPLQLALTDILLKFWVQLHQLTPNAFTQFSKYFWAVLSFDGKPNCDGFVKLYELHYQPKKVDADGVEKYQQFDCINFHARQGIGVKLTLAIKNKWSAVTP